MRNPGKAVLMFGVYLTFLGAIRTTWTIRQS